MQADKINQYFLTNGKYFPEEKIPALRAKMSGFTESQESMLYGLSFHDPLVVELVSIFIGGLGIDRFMLGDIGMGALKLLTGGCCGVLWLYDAITIMKRAREVNFNKVMQFM